MQNEIVYVKTGLPFFKKTSPVTSSHTSPPTSPSISDDFMSGSLIDAVKKTGLDPMKKSQLRDAISSILEKEKN